MVQRNTQYSPSVSSNSSVESLPYDDDPHSHGDQLQDPDPVIEDHEEIERQLRSVISTDILNVSRGIISTRLLTNFPHNPSQHSLQDGNQPSNSYISLRDITPTPANRLSVQSRTSELDTPSHSPRRGNLTPHPIIDESIETYSALRHANPHELLALSSDRSQRHTGQATRVTFSSDPTNPVEHEPSPPPPYSTPIELSATMGSHHSRPTTQSSQSAPQTTTNLPLRGIMRRESSSTHHSTSTASNSRQSSDGHGTGSVTRRHRSSRHSNSNSASSGQRGASSISSSQSHIQAYAGMTTDLDDYIRIQSDIGIPMIFSDPRLNVLNQFAREYQNLRSITSRTKSLFKRSPPHYDRIYLALESTSTDVQPPFIVNASSPASPALLLTLFSPTLKSRSKRIRNATIALPHYKNGKSLGKTRFRSIVKATFLLLDQIKADQGIITTKASDL
jgi:hypothetical protein